MKKNSFYVVNVVYSSSVHDSYVVNTKTEVRRLIDLFKRIDLSYGINGVTYDVKEFREL